MTTSDSQMTRAISEPLPMASRLELSEEAVQANLNTFRAQIGPSPRLGVVLKGNAYGHGLNEMLELVHERADVLYVIAPDDALTIRQWESSNRRVQRDTVVLGAIASYEFAELARAKVQAVIAGPVIHEAVEVIRASKNRLQVHIHLDTGLGREGFTPHQLRDGEADFLLRHRDVFECVGVMTHFSNTEDVTEQAYAVEQLHVFHEGVGELRRRSIVGDAVEQHTAASAGALVLPASRLTAVRIGIGVYGLWPSSETRLSARVLGDTLPVLRPVLSWKVPSQIVKTLPAGSYVGYGCTYRCAVDTRIAVLPVGYFDGYPRLASGKAHVLVRGQRTPVLGRVMMNHLIVDVSNVTTDNGPIDATLIGIDGDESISVEMLAGWAQTIHYEIVTRLGAHLRRAIVRAPSSSHRQR